MPLSKEALKRQLEQESRQSAANPRSPSGVKAQGDSLAQAITKFREATTSSGRRTAFKQVAKHKLAGAEAVLPVVERMLADSEKQYVRLLEGMLKDAYIERLSKFSNEQIEQVQSTRRLWRHYALTAQGQKNFREVFLDSAYKTQALLLIDASQIKDKAVAAKRKELLELGAYQTECRDALSDTAESAEAKTSPTGKPFPKVDEPMTFEDYLSYLERTLVLACTIAPPDGQRVLIDAAQVARELDKEEAEFVMFANEVRMVIGTQAWTANLVTAACARDHSIDRKAGRASGHWSEVPGKKGFGDRLRYWGARGRSEGAGGGRSGRGYIIGLSYGGGHTGPLYSHKRNVTGVGRRDGIYTSIYYKDKKFDHICPLLEGELFMPPGITRDAIKSSQLKSLYMALHDGKFGKAYEIARSAEVSDPVEAIVLAFFKMAIDVELDFRVNELERIAAAGDVYEADRRLQVAKADFAGLPVFAGRIAGLQKHLDKTLTEHVREAGETYYKMLRAHYSADNAKKFVEKFAGTEYAKATQYLLDSNMGDDNGGFHPLEYFASKDETLRHFPYLLDELKH